MKKIEAYIRHEAFEPIRMELLDLGFPSLTISEVKGSGRQKGITEVYRGMKEVGNLLKKVKLNRFGSAKPAPDRLVPKALPAAESSAENAPAEGAESAGSESAS